MSTISTCTLDTADSISSILNLKKIENILIDLSNIFTTLDLTKHIEDNSESIVESNDFIHET